eukprot:6488917-Amphidinium_carterae.1
MLVEQRVCNEKSTASVCHQIDNRPWLQQPREKSQSMPPNARSGQKSQPLLWIDGSNHATCRNDWDMAACARLPEVFSQCGKHSTMTFPGP